MHDNPMQFSIFCALFMHAPKLRRTFFIPCTFIIANVKHLPNAHTEMQSQLLKICVYILFFATERPKEET